MKYLIPAWQTPCEPVCRGIYLAAVFYHKDSLLVTAEDQIPIVEVDDSYSSSLMQDFLWFTKVQNAVSKPLSEDLSLILNADISEHEPELLISSA